MGVDDRSANVELPRFRARQIAGPRAIAELRFRTRKLAETAPSRA